MHPLPAFPGAPRTRPVAVRVGVKAAKPPCAVTARARETASVSGWGVLGCVGQRLRMLGTQCLVHHGVMRASLKLTSDVLEEALDGLHVERPLKGNELWTRALIESFRHALNSIAYNGERERVAAERARGDLGGRGPHPADAHRGRRGQAWETPPEVVQVYECGLSTLGVAEPMRGQLFVTLTHVFFASAESSRGGGARGGARGGERVILRVPLTSVAVCGLYDRRTGEVLTHADAMVSNDTDRVAVAIDFAPGTADAWELVNLMDPVNACRFIAVLSALMNQLKQADESIFRRLLNHVFPCAEIL